MIWPMLAEQPSIRCSFWCFKVVRDSRFKPHMLHNAGSFVQWQWLCTIDGGVIDDIESPEANRNMEIVEANSRMLSINNHPISGLRTVQLAMKPRHFSFVSSVVCLQFTVITKGLIFQLYYHSTYLRAINKFFTRPSRTRSPSFLLLPCMPPRRSFHPNRTWFVLTLLNFFPTFFCAGLLVLSLPYM